MRLVLMHVDDIGHVHGSTFEEEASYIVPGGERTVLIGPFAALEQMFPLLREASAGVPTQVCDGCGGSIAAVPQWSAPEP